MPDQKISQDGVINGADVNPSQDFIPIVDPSSLLAQRNKRIYVEELKIALDVDLVDNTSDMAKPVSTAQAAADLAAENNAKAYADGLVVNLWDDRGNFDASVNAYPSSGGSGSAGAIKKGDIWTISVAGTLPTAQVVEVGDTVRAKQDTPGNTQANWAIQQTNIGYTAENSANKVTAGISASATQYPSNDAVLAWFATWMATAAASGKKNPIYINDAGALVKKAWTEIDSTLKRTTTTAVDDTATVEEWLNSSLQSILKINANREVEFGGATSFWEVLSSIADGLAGLLVNTNQNNAWSFGDGLSTLAKLRTLTGDKAFVFTMKYEQDSGLGFVNQIRQYNETVTGTAATAYLIASIPIAASQFYEITVLHAKAKTAGNKINSCNVFKSVGWNNAGTLSGNNTTETIVPLRLTATTGGWSVVLNDTTDSWELWYTAETGVTSSTICDVQISISLR